MDIPLTIEDAAVDLRTGRISSLELTTKLLERIHHLNPTLGAFVIETPNSALSAAERADLELRSGHDRGLLHGIPLAIKDFIFTREAHVSLGCLIAKRMNSRRIDAPVVSRLRHAGGVIIGKTSAYPYTGNFAEGDQTCTAPRNPWDFKFTTSGSSSGTSVAVSAGMALGGLGTDTTGSVRAPAAYTGHTGLKVTFGRVPKAGVIPLSESLDTIGPMARSGRSCAILLQAIAGQHRLDPSSAAVPVPNYTTALCGHLNGITVGVPLAYFFDCSDLDPEVRDAVLNVAHVLQELGASIKEVSIPYPDDAKNAASVIARAEFLGSQSDDLSTRWPHLNAFVRSSLERSALLTVDDVAYAHRFRSYFRAELSKLMEGIDVLLTPAMPTPARNAGTLDPSVSSSEPYFLSQWNLADMPAAVAPCGLSRVGMPMSMQIVGTAFAEPTVLRVVDAFQRSTDWHLHTPPIPTLFDA